LKLPKGSSEAVNQRTAQWPKEKGQAMIYKTLHCKLKMGQHEPHEKPE
jgi:ribonuclease HIII